MLPSMEKLSKGEKNRLRIAHKRERDGRIRDRIKAVLLTDEGWTPQQIAKVLLISDQAVRDHVRDYCHSNKLCPSSGGSEEKLSKQQSELLEDHLDNHTYLYVKDIVAYVQNKWSVSYTVHGMRGWLQRHGFSYKKPAIVPGKADKEAQAKWLANYEKLKHNLGADETICFMDGVHPTHNVEVAYGWIKRGVRKEIPANTGRSRINLCGAIDMISHQLTFQEDQTLDAESTIRFFRRLEDAYPNHEKVHVFCDNARYYRNKKVKKYLEDSKIILHFLPPYSPNLNPIERLWKWMKERVIYNTYYEEFEDFTSAVLGFCSLVSTLGADSDLGKTLRSRVRDKFTPIGAPSSNF